LNAQPSDKLAQAAAFGPNLPSGRLLAMTPKAAAHCLLALKLSKFMLLLATLLPKVCKVLLGCSIGRASLGIG
jgi:hypothetical protein